MILLYRLLERIFSSFGLNITSNDLEGMLNASLDNDYSEADPDEERAGNQLKTFKLGDKPSKNPSEEAKDKFVEEELAVVKNIKRGICKHTHTHINIYICILFKNS